jgi:hypothetical protein
MKTMSKLKEKARFFHNDFFVFDTETTPFKEGETCKFIFGIIYGHNFIKKIDSINEFKKEFENERYKKKKVFAHNAEFDLSVIYDNIFSLDDKAIFNGKFIACTNGNCIFGDSLNIFPTSVKEIGKMIGKEKQELSKEFWNKSEVTENDIKYCVRDCEIIFDALLQIFETVGNVKITIAGLSMDLYRRKYQPYHIDYNETLGLEFFHSYFGGRTEAFKLGKVDSVVYDINSMYPFAMNECIFPNPKYLKKAKYINVKVFINHYLKKYEGCAHVEIHHNDTYFGCLPYRFNNKLLFPVGNFMGWYNFNELRWPLEMGFITIKSVIEIIYSPPMISPFTKYVQDIFLKRQETSSDFMKYLYKLFMNSLYGKFAQRITSEFIYLNSMEKEYETIEHYKALKQLIRIQLFNENRDDCFLEICTGSAKYLYNTIPLFSSYITSFSRILLLQKLIKYQKFKPTYCDTDSIFFDVDPKIKNSIKLGDFKKEEKNVIEIRGLKNYSYISESIKKDKIKGVPKNAVKNGDKHEYFTLLKTKEALRRGKKSGEYTKRTKECTFLYDKRIVGSDGTTSPIIF